MADIRDLEKVYESLPKLECKGKCQDYCGVIPLSRLEIDRIAVRLRKFPVAKTLVCPMLTDDGRCQVYDIRPLICRVWGLTEKLRCPHGCEPERWLSDEEIRLLAIRVNKIGDGATMIDVDLSVVIEMEQACASLTKK